MKKGILFWMTTIILATVIFMSVGGTAYSMEKNTGTAPGIEKYYQELEGEFVGEVKLLLCSEGYTNAGVMLTKRTFEDGSRQYKLNIHHRRFNESRQEEMTDMIEDIVLDVPNSSIYVTFD